jgi:phage recombination protein Bet
LTAKAVASTSFSIDPREWALLKKLYPEVPDEQLELFVMRAKKAGLDPFAQQIYLLQRKTKDKATGKWIPSWNTLVGIDGLRVIADRTEAYAPGKAPEFQEDAQGRLISATAYVMKLVRDKWFEVSASAFYEEYVQIKDGQPMAMWQKMPRSQLAKCAEAAALRRAFPGETFGLYETAEVSTDTETTPTETTPYVHPVRPAPAQPPKAPARQSNPSGTFAVINSEVRTNAKGTPYLFLRLGAPSGVEIDAIMITDNCADAEIALAPGALVQGALSPHPSKKPDAPQVFTLAETQ